MTVRSSGAFRIIAEAILMGSLILIGVVHCSHMNSSEAMLDSYGFFSESSFEGEKMRWAWRESYMHVRPQTEILGMSVWVPPELVQDGPLELAVMLNDRLLDRRIFFEGGKKSGYYVVPDIMRSQHVEVKFQANKTYNPFRLGFTRDATRNREQCVAIGDIRFLRIMPFQGLGFLPPGQADELLRKQCRDMPDGFRWTGRRATIDIEQEIPKGAELVLCCLHPDIEKQPVSVEIEIDGKRSQAVDFTSHAAQTIAVPEALVAGARGLTLTASRTWNPRIEKITDDDRDLGIAVAVRPY